MFLCDIKIFHAISVLEIRLYYVLQYLIVIFAPLEKMVKYWNGFILRFSFSVRDICFILRYQREVTFGVVLDAKSL